MESDVPKLIQSLAENDIGKAEGQEDDDRMYRGHIKAFEILLYSRKLGGGGGKHPPQNGNGDEPVHATRRKLQVAGLRLRQARWFDAADALDLLSERILQSKGSFPSTAILTVLSSLAQLPTSSSSSTKPPPLGRLSAALVSKAQQSMEPMAVLKASHRTKHGEVPIIPVEDHLKEKEEEQLQEQEGWGSFDVDSGPDYLVYGESSLLDALEETKGVYGSSIYPRNLFERMEHVEAFNSTTEGSAGPSSSYSLDHPDHHNECSAFVDPPQPELSLFSALRAGGLTRFTAAHLRNVSLRLTLPTLGDDRTRDPADAVLRQSEVSSRRALRNRPTHRKGVLPQPKGGDIDSQEVGIEDENAPPDTLAPLSQPMWTSVGWEGTWNSKLGLQVIPMPPPLVTQDGPEAFEDAAIGVVGQSSAKLVSEAEMIQHIFYALNGYPSASFHLDDFLMCLSPTSNRRTWGRTTRCVEKVLRVFSEAGTAYIRLEALVRYTRQEGQGQVILAFINALSSQLILFQSLVEEQRQAFTAQQGTLLTVLTATTKLRSHLGFLANLCDCRARRSWSASTCMKKLPTGAALLSRLYHTVRHAEAGPEDTAIEREVLLALLEEAAVPYLTVLAKWVYQGNVSETDDPYHEFQLRVLPGYLSPDDPGGSAFLTQAFHEEEEENKGVGRLPPFIPPRLARRVIMAGKLIHLLSRAHRTYFKGCARDKLPALHLISLPNGIDRGPANEQEGEEDFEAIEALDRLVQRRILEKVMAGEKEISNQKRAAEAERRIIRDLEQKMKKQIEAAGAKDWEYRRSLLHQIREAEERRERERLAEREEEQEMVKLRQHEEGRRVEEAKRRMLEKYDVLVRQAESRVARALWRKERAERLGDGRFRLAKLRREEARRWQAERGQRGEEDDDGLVNMAVLTIESASAKRRRGGGGGGGHEEDLLYIQKSAELPFSGLKKIVQEPGGSSAQMSHLLSIDNERRNSHRSSPFSDDAEVKSPSSTAFSGKRIVAESGGSSVSIIGLLRGISDERPSLPREEYGIEQSVGGLPKLPYCFGSAMSSLQQSAADGGGLSEIASWFHASSSPDESAATVEANGLEHPGLQIDEVVGGIYTCPSASSVPASLPLELQEDHQQQLSVQEEEEEEEEDGEDRGKTSPSFSGIHVLKAPGDSSTQMDEALHGRSRSSRSSAATLVAEEGNFSGIRIAQEPGSSSRRVASYLWGEKGGQPQALGQDEADGDPAAPASKEDEEKERLQQSITQHPAKDNRSTAEMADARATVARITGCDLLKTSEKAGQEAIFTSIIDGTATTDAQRGRRGTGGLNTLPLERALSRQCEVVEKAAIAYMIHEAHVGRHILALKRYMLGAGSTVLKEFVVLFQARITEEGSNSFACVDWSRPANILQCFNEAVSTAGLNSDPCLPCFTYVMRRDNHNSQAAAAATSRAAAGEKKRAGRYELCVLDKLEPWYRPPWPLGMVLPRHVLQAYHGLHRVILRLHWLINVVQSCRLAVSAAISSAPTSSSASAAHKQPFSKWAVRALHAILHRLAGLAAALLEHFAAQVEGDCWHRLQEMVEDCQSHVGGLRGTSTTVLDLRDAHEAYIKEVAARCFVSIEEEEHEDEGGSEGKQQQQQSFDRQSSSGGICEEVEAIVMLIGDACASIEAGLYAPESLAPRLISIRQSLMERLTTFAQALAQQRAVDQAYWGAASQSNGGLITRAAAGGRRKGLDRLIEQNKYLKAATFSRRGSLYCLYLTSRINDMLEAEKRAIGGGQM